eukprot:898947-Rhodomonas_salina.2
MPGLGSRISACSALGRCQCNGHTGKGKAAFQVKLSRNSTQEAPPPPYSPPTSAARFCPLPPPLRVPPSGLATTSAVRA